MESVKFCENLERKRPKTQKWGRTYQDRGVNRNLNLGPSIILLKNGLWGFRGFHGFRKIFKNLG